MEYSEYFQRFPDAYARIVAGLDRVNTLYAYLIDSGVLDGADSILSIGAGSGEVEVRIAERTGRQIAVIEPSQSYFDQFLENVKAAGVQELLLEAHRTSFEDFQPRRQYDVVLSLFSWFAFELDRELLLKALACRDAEGKLLICLPTADCPASKISAISRSSGINLTSEQLSAWARNEGFDHDYDVYHGVVPAELYLYGDELTEQGRDLASFLAATPWEEMSDELRQMSLAAIQSGKSGDQIDHASGCLIFDAGKHAASE
ncbi:class I SAM-dependent methyltransferase [Blastopirellula sp. JC732]|uniref:Class I SAM-dependent methyltransferase n=1 Tax=Blastopirellula sediminis TaxID=2894196 RepID=A0A9X1MRL8_9BACT|nr:class I SAM-dependent methyltransferase [Blastopirellula sediminis]MCC9606368.1 class I SAM-dependent methyltransferase [Blastopirellula sediminis]MCC9630334.1 class I SAM-dependent methyltransferase [Blastopirellula sediminis]